MIQVNLFTSSETASAHYASRSETTTKAALFEFFNIKDENKKKVRLVIHCKHNLEDMWKEFLEKNSDGNIEILLSLMPTDEYIQKVYVAFETDCEYSCKWDDDCFINRHVWDYMIENVDILSDGKHSALLPTFSNGIPSTDFFLNDIASPEIREQAHKIFLEDKVVPYIFQANYEKVNRNIESMKSWDVVNHWKFISDNYTVEPMGIHPARFSHKYNMLIAKYTCDNPHLVFSKNDYYLEKNFHTPYFCNNIFISKSNFYRESQKLYFDHWDEKQLNDLGKQRGMTPVFVRNCFGIHMAYGCTYTQPNIPIADCPTNQAEVETYYKTNFYNKHFSFNG